MKLTVFNGSPRKAAGNTNTIVKAFLKGVEKAGWETENIFLAEKNIEHCGGCFACWGVTPGICKIKDDMGELIEKFIKSDIVCFASPLYTESVTSITKKFMERLIPFVNPHFREKNGETRHVLRYEKYPHYIVISNCGYAELSQFEVMSHLFHRFANETDVEVKLEIYRTEGELLKVRHILLKPVINKYLKSVEKAGFQFASNGKVEQKLMEKLNKPLIGEKLYREKANEHWNKKIRNL